MASMKNICPECGKPKEWKKKCKYCGFIETTEKMEEGVPGRPNLF